MTFQEFRKIVLYHKIIEWDENEIVLDNGIRIRIDKVISLCYDINTK